MSDSSARRILEAVQAWIAAAPPGARLPSQRSLVQQHAASPVTVQQAMHQLTALGLVETRPGVGTFVRTVRPAPVADHAWQTGALGASRQRSDGLSATQRTPGPDDLALHSGYPCGELLPERLVRAALVRAARTPEALTRSPAAGLPALRSWFAGEVARGAPTGVAGPTARDVLITAGTQSALSSVFRAVVGPGRPLLVESPTYWGALLAAEQAGVDIVPVASGPHGPDPDEVDRLLAATGARAFYAQPSFANPTGAQWSVAAADAVLDVVTDRGAFLVEDDWAHDLAIDAEVRSLVDRDAAGHVIHLRSLTKSVSPALRVAAVVARGPALERILVDRAAETMYVSGVLQAAALDVVTTGGWASHLRGLRHQLRARRDLLLQSLAAHAPQARVEHVPLGGLNLWVRLPDGTDVERVVADCAAQRLLVAPGREWFPAEPTGPYLRLNFSGPEPGRFDEAARVLGRALDAQAG